MLLTPNKLIGTSKTDLEELGVGWGICPKNFSYTKKKEENNFFLMIVKTLCLDIIDAYSVSIGWMDG